VAGSTQIPAHVSVIRGAPVFFSIIEDGKLPYNFTSVAVGSNLDRDFGFFHVRKLSSYLTEC
jgi:hypothetical protein